MHLVQILLPLADNEGRPFPRAAIEALRRELAERFGGVTLYSRGPAEGVWRAEGWTAHDDIVVAEVMCDPLDEGWWRGFRERLERDFRQEEVVVRALPLRRL
ncbi:hypothetical protein [Rubellimicrobium sp. CFH 75288]|uniref:hypothetical protein n=1 Tax=Rubellimicrobium sp. CFH 75288 TaxID=2697034 RepID=UPI0014125191|nr:hypothetical protein [Rubellimicrobium sp. CFH 75288]NAZ36250.1 hypothetical protein [Rubellimicrobium sp. CFH 75288]